MWPAGWRRYNADLDNAEAISVVHGAFNFVALLAFSGPTPSEERLRDSWGARPVPVRTVAGGPGRTSS